MLPEHGFTPEQIARARARAFGATHTRDRTGTADAVDYTQFTDPELRAAQAEALAALDGEDAGDEQVRTADAITAEIERRNAITDATNARRRRLAEMQVTERWRPEGGQSGGRPDPGGPAERGQRGAGERPRGDDGAALVPDNWRALAGEGLRSYTERGMTGTAEILNLPRATDLRTLVTTTTYPSQAQRVPGVLYPPPPQLRVADLLDQQTATSGVIEWVIETASPVSANTAVEVAEGAAKPEGAFTFTVASKALATIAVWVPITRQAAEDEAQLTGYIQGRLSYSCEKRLDSQILNGDGTAPNMRGILNTTGVQTQSIGTDSLLVVVRKMITKVQVAGYDASGVVLNPVDWEAVELSTDDNGAWIFTNDPSSLVGPRVWGLPVVPTVAIAAGTMLVGAFREAATLWRKAGVRILMSDSHVDNFTKNILVILAEMRAQLAVYAPPAFVKSTA
jgi:HK97 family phage major capsid protein